MEAKLIKSDVQYRLHNEEGIVIATSTGGKLSISNCKAIERGYDLDELADFYGAKAKGSVDFKLGANQGFEDGFQKALEILGDKKYSVEDVKKAMYIAINYELKRDAQSYQEKIDFLKSLQQTKWDVEVEMDFIEEEQTGTDLVLGRFTPKLDANSCLILKPKI